MSIKPPYRRRRNVARGRSRAKSILCKNVGQSVKAENLSKASENHLART